MSSAAGCSSVALPSGKAELGGRELAVPAALCDLERSASRNPRLEPGEPVKLLAWRRGLERQLVLRGAATDA